MANFQQLKEIVQGGTAGTLGGSYSTTTLKGSCLIAGVACQGTGITCSNVADVTNGTWTKLLGPIQTSPGWAAYIFYFPNAAAATGAVTATWSTSIGANAGAIVLTEYANIVLSSPVDNDNQATANNINSTVSVTTTNAKDVIVVFGTTFSQYNSAGAGFTNRLNDISNGLLWDEDIVSSTGTYTDAPPQYSASQWSLIIGAFKIGNVALQMTGAIGVSGALNISIAPLLTGSIVATGIPTPALAPTGLTGSVQVTGTTNLPAVIPQLTGTIAITGATPAIGLGPKMTGSVQVTGTILPSLGLTGLTGSITVNGLVAPAVAPILVGTVLINGQLVPAVALTGLTGSVLVTGTILPALSITGLTGSVLVTGTTSLSGLFLVGAWGVSGVLNPALSPTGLTGAVHVTGQLVPGLGPPLAGSIGVSGLFNPAIAPQMIGSILVNGQLLPAIALPPLSGSVTASGLLIPGLSVPLTGNIFVTGQTALNSLSLIGQWGVSGILSPALAIPLTGSITASGLFKPAIGPQLQGLLSFLGNVSPSIAPQLAGLIKLTGLMTIGAQSPPVGTTIILLLPRGACSSQQPGSCLSSGQPRGGV